MFIGVDGRTVHCRSDGPPDGSALVFVNSLGSDLRIWDDVVAELSSHYRCLRYDKPGHGLSDKSESGYGLATQTRTLLAVLDSFEVESAAIVGISVGGLIALHTARRHSGRVSALVLCDTAARIGSAERWNERIRLVHEEGLAAVAERIAVGWFAPSFPQRAPAAVRGYVNMLARTASEGYVGTCAMLRDSDEEQGLPSIGCPALVITGGHDRGTPIEQGGSLAARLPRGRFSEIRDAGHLPCVERPRELARLMEDFFEEEH